MIFFGASVSVLTQKRWDETNAVASVRQAHVDKLLAAANEAGNHVGEGESAVKAAVDTYRAHSKAFAQHQTPARKSALDAETRAVDEKRSQQRNTLNVRTHRTDSLFGALDDSLGALHAVVDPMIPAQTWDTRIWFGSLTLIVVGTLLAVDGFRKWQTRVQNYQDAILKRQADGYARTPNFE